VAHSWPKRQLDDYYNAEGIGYSDDTIHLGTYDESLDQLERLERRSHRRGDRLTEP
jgi:hypothetical protein